MVAMHTRLREFLDHLDRSRDDLRQAVEDVPEARREHRPGPGRWSVAEVLEHLALVEARTARLLSLRIQEAERTGVGPDLDTGPIVPDFDLARVVDRGIRLTTGEASEPREGLDSATAWERFEKAHKDLRTAILTGEGLALGNVRAPHPRFGDLDVYQWVVFTAGHELRHAAQIREAGAVIA